MMYGWSDGNWGMMAAGMAFWALVAVAIVVGVIWATRRPNLAGMSGRTATARDLLDGRLVRGEIDEAEFQRLGALIQPR